LLGNFLVWQLFLARQSGPARHHQKQEGRE